ncbi:MAG: bifunctional diguanylate cyclase/phosphodiesterase [Marinomonas colpomeniae]
MLSTLKGRLYFLTALVVLPTYIFIYFSFSYSRDMVQEDLLDAARLVSNQAVNNQESLVNSTESFIVSLATLPQIRQPNSEACRQFLSEITPLLNRFSNIGVPNKDGMLTCSGIQLSSAIDVKDRRYVQDAMTFKRFSTSGVHIDRVLGHPTINFAYPVQKSETNSEIVGAAVVVMSLDWWGDLLNSNELPKGSVAYILDNKGQPVASYPDNIKYDPPSDLEAMWLGGDGINRVFVKRQVTDSNGDVLLTFLTGIAVDDALKSVNYRYTVMGIIFSIMVLIILILLKQFFMNAISKPLGILSDLALKLGERKHIDTTSAPATGVKEMDDLKNGFLEMAKQISDSERRVVLQSQTDSLTGISNRDALNEQLLNIIIENQGDQKIGVILLDLDNFKEVNDTRGHGIGDDVLKRIASRLVMHAPTAKLISRLGGDEFILVFESRDVNESHLLAVCEDIRNAIKEPLIISRTEIIVTASIGAALYPDDGENVKELMGAADQAMYFAKQSGRDAARRFNWELKDALIHKTELIKDLRQAILNQEFYLLYQPIVNKHGVVLKFEALIRWQHPEKGLIAPDQFISYAEESGQIIEIGHWVIQEAKQALGAIRSVYGENIQIGVNVSPIQLSKQQDGNGLLLADLLSKESCGNGQNSLVVEITEHLLMNLDESTRDALLAFREKGIQVALDDFGTGYSSLAYIMNYDIDYLKIDQSFVQKLGEEHASQTLCEAIISMAHALGVSVIAEGVETKEQANLLIGYGCDYLQGYYFSRPIPLDQVLIFKQDKLI